MHVYSTALKWGFSMINIIVSKFSILSIYIYGIVWINTYCKWKWHVKLKGWGDHEMILCSTFDFFIPKGKEHFYHSTETGDHGLSLEGRRPAPASSEQIYLAHTVTFYFNFFFLFLYIYFLLITLNFPAIQTTFSLLCFCSIYVAFSFNFFPFLKISFS